MKEAYLVVEKMVKEPDGPAITKILHVKPTHEKAVSAYKKEACSDRKVGTLEIKRVSSVIKKVKMRDRIEELLKLGQIRYSYCYKENEHMRVVITDWLDHHNLFKDLMQCCFDCVAIQEDVWPSEDCYYKAEYDVYINRDEEETLIELTPEIRAFCQAAKALKEKVSELCSEDTEEVLDKSKSYPFDKRFSDMCEQMATWENAVCKE